MKTIHRNLIPIIILLFTSSLRAHEGKDAEVLVHRYFEVFQKQEWDSLLGILHPELLIQSKASLIALLSDEKLSEETRKPLLGSYGVKDMAELIALDAKDFYLRTLRRGSDTKEMRAFKDEVKSIVEIGEIIIYEDGYVVSANVKSTLRGKEFAGTTTFSILEYEGKLLIRNMSKTKGKAGGK